jgi:hypothetical protein
LEVVPVDDSKAPWPVALLNAAGGAEVRAFFGYLVDVSDDQTKRYRLYLTLDLDDYIEIGGSQILHLKRVDESEQPLGGAYVWVRRTAKLRRVAGKSTEAQADFLRGEIEAEHRRMAVADFRINRLPTESGILCTAYTHCAPCERPVRFERDY